MTGHNAHGVRARDALLAVRDEPPPADPTAAGCVVSIVALVSVVMMPFVDDRINLPSPVLIAIGATLVGTSLVAGLVGIFGGKSGRVALGSLVEQAISALEADDGRSRSDEAFAAAARLIDAAPGLDVSATAERLGDALAFVQEVEAVLLDEGYVTPAFSLIRRTD